MAGRSDETAQEGEDVMDDIDKRLHGRGADGAQAIAEKAEELAGLIAEGLPASRERSLAMTKLEECVMWAEASIERNGGDAR